MALKQRIESLKKRHADIDSLIQAERTHPAPDPARLYNWKRLKLSLKDELTSLQERGQAA